MAGFRSTGSLAVTRFFPSAAWLDDVGRVLVAGGTDETVTVQLTAESFDPATETWSAAGTLHGPHQSAHLLSTPDGAVLVGGYPAAGADTLLEKWDAQASSWTAEVVPPYLAAVSGARLAGDRVEALCGVMQPDLLGTSRLVSVALADGTAKVLATPSYDRSNPYTCLLADGRMLVLAGMGYGLGGAGEVEFLTRTAEVYDPATGSWTPTGRLAVPHHSLDRANQCLVALPDGGALIVAGSDQLATYTDVVERWSPSTGRWTRMAPLPDRRDGHTTTVLPDGTVLVVGGENAAGVRADTYSYDLASDSWSPADPMATPRSGHVAVLIPDGRLLVIGGATGGSCEIFD